MRRMRVVGVGLVLLCCVVSPLQAKQLKVLAIGNSFSLSMMEQFPKVAAAYPGCELDVVNLYIAGCPLDKHWRNIEIGRTNALLRPYSVRASYTFDKKKMPKWANIPEMLATDRWDVVTIQQSSGKSAFAETYQPYADKLIGEIRRLAPQAEIRVHQTWSYSPYDGRLAAWKMTPETMYESLRSAYAELARQYGFKTIPVGDAVQLYRQRLPVRYGKVLTGKEIRAIERPGRVDFYGDVVGSSSWRKGDKGTRDGDQVKLRLDRCHLNRRGEYLQACVWLAALFEVDVTKLAYAPEFKDDHVDVQLMRTCANEAVRNQSRNASEVSR